MIFVIYDLSLQFPFDSWMKWILTVLAGILLGVYKIYDPKP